MAPILNETPRDTPDLPSANSSISSKPSTIDGNVIKRLQSELMTLMTSSTPGISAFPTNGTDLMHWTATITGPTETPYEGKSFRLTFEFTQAYPYKPPTVLFATPIYHPNIDFSGRICLDILKEKWSPGFGIGSVLVSLQSLLGEPNNASPLNGQAAELWDKDPAEYQRLVDARHQEPTLD